MRLICIVIFLANAFVFNNVQSQGFSVKGGPPQEIKPTEGIPLETRSQNATGQKPYLPGQTRAVEVITKTPVTTTVITDKLYHPWSIAFLPNGKALISEKKGQIRIASIDGTLSDTLSGVPKVLYMADAGLFDIAIDPDFLNNRTFYFSFVEPRGAVNGVAVASAKLSKDESKLEDLKVIYRVEPSFGMPAHFGSRLLIDKKGNIFVSTGERFMDNIRIQSQYVNSPLGKILRIKTDGTPADDNPNFNDSASWLKEIYAYGVRNPQGLAFHPETGDLWESEHGQQGGDEINIIQPGKNYGWPIIAYGTEYTGGPVNGGKTNQTGMEQPIYYWDPAIAPS
jgi:glucose/arabinose dehydrogenase